MQVCAKALSPECAHSAERARRAVTGGPGARGGPRVRRCPSASRAAPPQCAERAREALGGPHAERPWAPAPSLAPCLLAPLSPRLPGPAMGNVPCAVKQCLSYQQLLREHLWIGDSVAGALEPAQVPSRGPGRPLLSRRRGASPPGALPAALLRREGLSSEKGSHRLRG